MYSHTHTHAHTYTRTRTHTHTHTHTHTQVSSMQPGLSEKGMVRNAVLVDCLERAALVNYQEVFKLFVSQHPKEGKHAKIAAW